MSGTAAAEQAGEAGGFSTPPPAQPRSCGGSTASDTGSCSLGLGRAGGPAQGEGDRTAAPSGAPCTHPTALGMAALSLRAGPVTAALG